MDILQFARYYPDSSMLYNANMNKVHNTQTDEAASAIPDATSRGLLSTNPEVLKADSKNVLSIFLRYQSLYPIYRRLVSLLSPADIIILSRSCKALSSFYEEVLPQQWNINKALRYFTDDPLRLRSALNETNAVISGSFALDFFDRSVTSASQLEIIMGVYGWDKKAKPKDFIEWDIVEGTDEPGWIRRNNAGKLFHHLVDVEGYELSSDDHNDDDMIFHRGAARWIVEKFVNKAKGSYIRLAYPYTNVFSARRDAPLLGSRSFFMDSHLEPWGAECLADLVKYFATTAGANFILADRAISLFPTLTFSKRLAYTTSESVFMDLDYGMCAQPLVRRNIWPERLFFPVSPTSYEHRRLGVVGDMDLEIWHEEERRLIGPTSWVLPLDMTGVKGSDIPDRVVDAASYRITVMSYAVGGSHREREVPSGQKIAIAAVAYRSPSLRHTYCLGLVPPLGEENGYNARGLSGFIHAKAEAAWMLYYNRKISASNANRIDSRVEAFKTRVREELIREGPRLSDDWLRDEEMSAWIKEYFEDDRKLDVWPLDPNVTMPIVGITRPKEAQDG